MTDLTDLTDLTDQTGLLRTPWSGSSLTAALPAHPFDPAQVLDSAGAGSADRWPGGDPLVCPWSRTTALPSALPAVRTLPSLGPDLPAQRAATGPAAVLA